MDEVLVSKLKSQEEDVHVAEPTTEHCDRCGHPMPAGCIGWCASCDEAMGGDPFAEFYAWGGWRRAFGEYTDEEWAARVPCRFERTNSPA